MKKFRIKVWRTRLEKGYCMQILEQPADSLGRTHFVSTTGYNVISASNPEYRYFSKELFLRGTREYLDSVILSIPEEEFSVIMKSLKEFCSQMQWEFDYEVEGIFGSL